jgi:UDP-glucuronate 4-epimerase
MSAPTNASAKAFHTGDPILVTGAAGFIGSAVAARLAHMGHAVSACDNFNDYYDPAYKGGRVAALLAPAGVACETVELSDAAQVAGLFARARPAAVVHLAAQAGVRHSLVDPGAYVQANLVAFGHVLEACRRHRVRHLLYASSSSVYGSCDGNCGGNGNGAAPSREHDPTDAPVSLYAATKKANELMAHACSHVHRMPASGVRLFTVYGPWGRPDMACCLFARRLLAGEPIPVFAEGRLRRAFTYIDDVVESLVRLLFKPPDAAGGAPHWVLNVGHERPVRVLDFIRAMEAAFGVTACLDFQPMQPGDVTSTHADSSRLHDWIGYRPQTRLQEGVGKFARWYVQEVHTNSMFL